MCMGGVVVVVWHRDTHKTKVSHIVLKTFKVGLY